jgi:hypothetical protein
MTTGEERPTSPLSVEVEPKLRRRLEDAAAHRRIPVREYVIEVLEQAVDEQPRSIRPDDAAWSRLSAGAFARDWDSDADAVYDELA